MKNFKFKWLLLSIVLSIASINTAWAWYIGSGKTIYFDNYIAEWTYPEMQVYQNESNKPSYRFNQIGTTTFYYYNFSDGWSGYDHILYYNYTGSGWGNKSANQSYDIPNNCVIVAKSGSEGTAVGYFTNYKKAYPDQRVYFDATPVAGWGDKAYLRYGFDCVAHADEMTKFPGTANLFYIDIKEAYYEKYTVSNSYGYTKASTVYQPTDKCEPTGAAAITRSLNFSDTDINGGESKILSFIPTTKASTSYSCDWWNYTKNTNTSIPTKTVTVSSTTNGKIRVEYYNTSGTSTYWEGSGGTTLTVPQSAIITVKALGNAGYDANSITVAGNSFTNGNTYTVTSNITISATFVTAYAFVQGRMHVKSGSPSGSWINTFDGEGDSDKWEESSSVIKFTYDGTSGKYVLHTYVTPSDLSSNFEGSLPPYFYVATSSSSVSYTGLRKYRPSEGKTITGANSKASITEMSGSHSVRINSDVTTSYVVLYFDQSDVWYELEQTLNYAAGEGSGGAPATTYHMNGSSVAAAAANTFTAPTGYHFDHWSGSDGENYAAGASVPMNSNITLTAIYAPNTYTINLDDNSASTAVSPSSVTTTFDSNVLSASITAPKKTGNVFAGWYSGVGGTGDQVIDATGALRANVDGYTGAEGIWTKDATPVTLYAKWIAIADLDCWDNEGNYLCGDIAGFATPKPDATNWNTATNWPNNTAPTIETSVVLTSNMTVDADHAKAKEIVLKDGIKLTIEPNKGLEVAGTITKADGSAPTASDLVLGSSEDGNATLIFNNNNSAAATVQMYSIASVVEGTWNWQYMAPAFTDANALYDYYGSYLYKWNNGGWNPVANGATLDPFAGYCITNKTANSTYVTDGTLVATTSYTVNLGEGVDMVIGNSWTAPIYIGGFTAETFTSTPATIYLFNTGSAENGSKAGTGPGTYETIPVNSGEYIGNNLIAPLQAFFVTTVGVGGSAGTITMNYDELVRTTTNDHSVNAGPMHAPKRVNEEEDPEVMKIWAIGAEYSDRLVILEREDFTTGFDNGWDGEKKSFSDVAPSVYVITETEKDAVSAVPDYEGTILGFLAGIDTQCTMNFDYNGEENWYLNDLKEEQSTLITNENSYSFSCSSTDAETRFVISRTPIHKVPTGTENVSAGTNARKQMINGVLYVIRDGRIYNAEGSLVK